MLKKTYHLIPKLPLKKEKPKKAHFAKFLTRPFIIKTLSPPNDNMVQELPFICYIPLLYPVEVLLRGSLPTYPLLPIFEHNFNHADYFSQQII